MKLIIKLGFTCCLIFIGLLTVTSVYGYQAEFVPMISINSETTDNMFLSNEKDTRINELITTVSPGFVTSISGKTGRTELSYHPVFSFYDKYDDFNTIRHNSEFNGWAQLGKNTRLVYNNSFLLTEEPFRTGSITDQQVDVYDTSVRRTRETYYNNSAGFGLTYQFGESDSIALNYSFSMLRNEDETIEDNDRSQPSVNFIYYFSRSFGIEADISFVRAEFDTLDAANAPAGYIPTDDFNEFDGQIRLIRNFSRHFEFFFQYAHIIMDYDHDDLTDSEKYQMYDPSIGVRYIADENTTFSLSIGYYTRDFEESDDDSGLSFSGNLDKEFLYKRGQISLAGTSGYRVASFNTENSGFATYWQFGSDAEYRLTKLLNFNATGSFRQDDFQDLIERRDNTILVGFGFNLQPVRWLTISLDYSYRNCDSTLNDDDYQENRCMLNITLSPHRPFRKTY